MKIDIERYNKSTMPENAEKYFYGPTGIRTIKSNYNSNYIYINGEIIINSANMYLINLYLSAFAFRLHQRSKINKKLKKLSYNIYIFKSNMNKKQKMTQINLIEQIYPLNGDIRIQTIYIYIYNKRTRKLSCEPCQYLSVELC